MLLTRSVLVSALSIAVSFAFSLSNAHARDVTHPTQHDLEVWKHDVIHKYDRAIYLDEHGNLISEQDFFRKVRNEMRSHEITTTVGSTKMITLRLLPRVYPMFTPGKSTTMGGLLQWKHDMIDPYKKVVCLDERGREIPEAEFFRLTANEKRSSTMDSEPGVMDLITLRLRPRADTAFTTHPQNLTMQK